MDDFESRRVARLRAERGGVHAISDLTLVRQLLDRDDIHANERQAFADMVEYLMKDPVHILSKKQRAWVEDVYARLHRDAVSANLVSSGLVPRGREVESPKVLRELPKKPPKKRA